MPKQRAFLWINKSAVSSSFSNSFDETEESRRIFAHAQPGKSSRLKRSISYKRRVFEWRQASPARGAEHSPTSTPTVGKIHRTSKESTATDEDAPVSAPPTLGEKSSDPDNKEPLLPQCTSIVPLRGSMDPFASTPVRAQPEILDGLYYFENVWAPLAFRSPLQTKTQHRLLPADVNDVISLCFTDELHMYSLLAAVSMRMQTIHAPNGAVPDAKPQEYATKALRHLRLQLAREKRLSENHSLDILFLAACELYCSNVRGTQAHLRALTSLGPEMIPNNYLKLLCRNIDLFAATTFLAKPVLPSLRKPQLPTSSPKISKIGSMQSLQTRFGSGFWPHPHILGHATLATIEDMVVIAEAAESLRQRRTEEIQEDLQSQRTILDIVEQSEQLSFELVCNMPHRPLLDPGQVTTTKESCIIALLMWLSYLPVSLSDFINKPPMSGSSRKMIPGRGTALVNRLKRLNFSDASMESCLELILWILAVGMVCSVDADDIEWCARAFVEVTLSLELTTAVELNGALRRYLPLQNFDLVDNNVMASLLDTATREQAIEVMVTWAAATKAVDCDKERLTRVTSRPSNLYRTGA